jgi:hypothetical protein
MNRKLAINVILGFAFGASLALLGFPYTTWQYWLLSVLLWGMILNSLIDER